jgi:RPA family protein
VTFKTTDGKKEYSAQATIVQAGAIVDASVANFLAAPVGDALYRLTGVITKVEKAEYGNIYIRDYSGEVYIYGIGEKGAFEASGLVEGDIVTLVGKRGEYKGTAQMVKAQTDSYNKVYEKTIAEFLAEPDDSQLYYRVTGIVDEIANDTYGNLYLKDGDTRLYVYGCYPGWGATGDARKGAVEAFDIEVGDKLTVIGKKSVHDGTPQVSNGVFYSLVKAN